MLNTKCNMRKKIFSDLSEVSLTSDGFITVSGIILKPDWTSTFLSIPIGKSQRFERRQITPSRARLLASHLKRKYNASFTVNASDMEEYCDVYHNC